MADPGHGVAEQADFPETSWNVASGSPCAISALFKRVRLSSHCRRDARVLALRVAPKHEVAALQPAARGRKRRGR